MTRHALTLLLLLGIAPAALASETYTPPPESIKPPREMVQNLYAVKCSKCHPITRPDGATKDAAGWKATVDRMAAMDPSWIPAAEAGKIARFLGGRALTKAKCNKCHAETRADVNKTEAQWQTTLDRMQSKDMNWISNADKDLVKFYLSDILLLELD